MVVDINEQTKALSDCEPVLAKNRNVLFIQATTINKRRFFGGRLPQNDKLYIEISNYY